MLVFLVIFYGENSKSKQDKDLRSTSSKWTHPAFTCSKLTIETPGKGVKYVQSYQ